MELSRRRVLRLGALAATAPVLAACGSGAGNSAGKLKFAGWDYESALVEQNIKRFQQLNKDIQIAYTPVTSSSYVQKTVAEFTAGDGPDVLYVYDDSLAGWVDAGYLQPLDDLPGIDQLYGQIYPGNVEAMTYNGKRYALPYYTDSVCLVYNAAILAKAGIKNPPRSLPELEAQAKKIQSAGILANPIGVSALLQDTSWGWLWSLVFASGGDFFDAHGEPVMDKTPVAKDIVSWILKATNETKIIDPSAIQLTGQAIGTAMMTERYAFTFESRYGVQLYNDPKQSKAAGKFKIGYLPSLDGRVVGTMSTTRMYALAKETQAKDKAMKLLGYLGGVDSSGLPYTAKFWFLRKGLGFAYRSLEKDAEVQDALRKFVDPAVYSGIAAIAKPRSVNGQPWYGEYEHQQQATIQRVLSKQTTPEAAMTTLAQAARTLKKKYA
ncbi:ABC transporter substrate-binding protein [Fodinicola acaciae]|uniref:ABC transporter substrate-binding protein n=1 Tax=Fodinicola acaciae TaxID=2681555 RepID=UPI0013D61949|nr:extracellular solute-binding protein [Fodinicola acaciae]